MHDVVIVIVCDDEPQFFIKFLPHGRLHACSLGAHRILEEVRVDGENLKKGANWI